MDTLSAAPIYVRVLGGFSLTGADGCALTLAGKKMRALVALLAFPPNPGWSRERLASILWGDRNEELARGSLRHALAELRRVLGDQVLVSNRETVALDPNSVKVDAVEFCALCQTRQWDKAVDAYPGDLLSGVTLPDGAFADWLLVERIRLHDLAALAFRQVLDQQSGTAAIRTAQRLLTLDPDSEDVHRKLMQLYSSAGDRSQALKQYQLCRDHLQRELGVKPAAETDQLYQQLRELLGVRPPAPPSQPLEPLAPHSRPTRFVSGRRKLGRSYQAIAFAGACLIALAIWLLATSSSRDLSDVSSSSVLSLRILTTSGTVSVGCSQ